MNAPSARIVLRNDAYIALDKLPDWVNAPRLLATVLKTEQSAAYPQLSRRRVPLPQTDRNSEMVLEACKRIEELGFDKRAPKPASAFRAKHVVEIPYLLRTGTLYVSEKYNTVAHLCPCGCGEDVFIPIGEPGWKLFLNEGKVTLSPSLQHRFKCRSHYFIEDNQVRWCQ